MPSFTSAITVSVLEVLISFNSLAACHLLQCDTSLVQGQKEGDSESKDVAFPAACSDEVAEAALGCCQALLQRCKPQSKETAIRLMQCFCKICALPRHKASEEVSPAMQGFDGYRQPSCAKSRTVLSMHCCAGAAWGSALHHTFIGR